MDATAPSGSVQTASASLVPRDLAALTGGAVTLEQHVAILHELQSSVGQSLWDYMQRFVTIDLFFSHLQ